jgi:acetyl esterase/lipase/Flp pilus assembly protein TadD
MDSSNSTTPRTRREPRVLRQTAFLGIVILANAGASAARAQDAPRPSDPLDLTTYRLVLREPGMDEASERPDQVYDAAAGLKFDRFTPKGHDAKRPVPAVVFANGVGMVSDPPQLKDWAIYDDWARLIAARGMIGITMDARRETAGDDLAHLVAHLRSHAAEYGIRADRIGVYACSANTRSTLPLLMEDRPDGVAAAVICYGNAPVASFDDELPLMHIVVGGDGPYAARDAQGLWTRVVDARAPWTMIYAPTLPHAFDSMDRSPESLRMTRRIADFFERELEADDPAVDPAAESPAERATRLSYGNEPLAAAAAWLEVAEGSPRRTELRLRAASCYVRGERYAQAEPLLREALDAGADDPGVHRDFGRCLVALGREQDAVPHLERVVAAGIEDSYVMAMLGHAALLRSDADGGVRWYERAFAAGLQPGPAGHGIAAWNLACAYVRKGRTDDAFAKLREALAHGFGSRAELAADSDLAPLRTDSRWTELEQIADARRPR